MPDRDTPPLSAELAHLSGSRTDALAYHDDHGKPMCTDPIARNPQQHTAARLARVLREYFDPHAVFFGTTEFELCADTIMASLVVADPDVIVDAFSPKRDAEAALAAQAILLDAVLQTRITAR
ncbi:hypothetical protein GZH49_06425 [Nocardia terpenica]|uniref:hypothetical protein n=1 Tax=Nocardia terpenica TaxID=455432 RepID=UPI002FE3C051